MNRDYKTGKSNSVAVFSGLEIEHTPAYGLQTLFLARNDLTFDQIQELAVLSNAEAIYYGANRSYMHNHYMQVAQIIKFLEQGYYVTVDYPYELHQMVSQKFALFWKDPKFIPFCSIIMPETEEDTSLCFKIDDIDFNKTNPGVWTMSMKDFKEKAGYTKWEEYKQDEPIEEKQIWPIPQTQKS
jgi:hypothetical protein